MINVTQNAARQLRNLLAAQKQGAGKGLRVPVSYTHLTLPTICSV